ncbi:MAG: SurA N-terminal domain-containing protein [Peptococcaceae bacterium]|jgi:parvulin-like peptidyl-prolyl isomerase|nr:SurA N-terminal domain-containing protein [Peptococcaceae bacterium]MBQ5615613.1 SurA N-terminal domain-containing protein [Peptococcaceae bacterium]MBQ5658917.1 SurA N-terminal domain-containing protein [Peptococcaceae bacterium]MBQ5668910.1 SurA N-terminal domain-containing protein [Peptococcaceae bacterium]MBR0447949.1 SurA N-terminal domain-containing protein [Peptococcaceae bacterium]
MKKKLTAILLAVFLVTGLAGCGSKVPAGTVATVNGVAISQEELDANFNQFMQMYEAYGVDTSDETLQINLRNSLLESLIVQELIVQEAENREITVSDEDVNAYIQSVKDSYGDADAYVKVLEENGYTEASYAEAVREQMVIELFRDDLVNHPEVVDVAKARHILVATEEEALDVIAQLDKGADFAALAQDISTDMGSAVDGGDLGYFALNGDTTSKMVTEFSDAVRAQEIGVHSSAPVQSQFGYHIILVEDRELEVDLLSNPEKYSAVLQGIYNSGLDNLAMTLMENAEIEVLIDTTTMESAK